VQKLRIKIDIDKSTRLLGDLKPVAVVNFMYQLGEKVPRYLVKHHTECFCEDVLDEINI
jgi:hypothetical protein